MQKVLIATIPGMIEEKDWKLLSEVAEVEYLETAKITEADLIEKLKNFDHLMLNYDVIEELSDDFYKKLKEVNPGFKSISTDITGMGWAKPDRALETGIKVQNTPNYSTISVAEFTIFSLLLHARGISDFYNNIKINKTVDYKDKKNTSLYGSKVGIIGLGNIGLRVAELCNAFGMEVTGWNRSNKDFPSYIKFEEDLKKILAEVDFLIITLKNHPDTLGMFDYKMLSKAKKGVVIINHASNKLVNMEDLKKLLDEEIIGGYSSSHSGIEEAGLENNMKVTSFPAQAWFTDHSLNKLKEIWVGNVVSAIIGKFPNEIRE